MARLMLIGEVAQVELTTDDLDDVVIARCRLHPTVIRSTGAPCPWTERYDCMDDATEYAADHADRGTS